jgi:hypothetical protein
MRLFSHPMVEKISRRRYIALDDLCTLHCNTASAMFAAADHPFHIQTIAFYAALAPVAALFALLFVASLVRHRRCTRKAPAIDAARLRICPRKRTYEAIKPEGGTAMLL